MILREPALIPAATSYGVAILIVLSLSAFSLASHLHRRWFADRQVGLLAVYCGVLGCTVGWGLLVLDPRAWRLAAASAWAIGIAVGIPIALFGSWCDRRIVRALERWRRLRGGGGTPRAWSGSRGELGPAQAVRVRPVAADRRADPLARVRRRAGAELLPGPVGLPAVVTVGVLEEVLFRGVLVQLCLLLHPVSLVGLALAGSVLFFGLSHIEFGWPHVVAKMPLGLLALGGVLATGTLVPALIGHALFNAFVIRETRRAAGGGAVDLPLAGACARKTGPR